MEQLKKREREQEVLVDERKCGLGEVISRPKQKFDIQVKKKYLECFYVSFHQELH